jgi:predicted nucleic acid-binding protein
VTRAVLADTGPLYAAADPDDQYHELAQGQLQALADEGLSVVLAYTTPVQFLKDWSAAQLEGNQVA